MRSRLCDVPVYVEPQVVVGAMVYAVVFAATTCGLAMCAYVHVFGLGLRPRAPSAAILLAGLLGWYTLATAYWVAPLVGAVHTYFRHGQASLSSSGSSMDDTLQSPAAAPVLMCATPGVLAISILVGEAIMWWRVCAVWAGNRAVRGVCAVSLFVTLVFVGVMGGRLALMKAPPTRLAVMFFVEPDGVGTCASVLVSNAVQAALLWSKLRAAVTATFSGASWVVIAASRRQIWTAFRDDNPTRALWTFALFVATASCMRVPALVWWLPQSFALAPVTAADENGEGRAARGGDSRDDRTRVDSDEGRVGGAGDSERLIFGYQAEALL